MKTSKERKIKMDKWEILRTILINNYRDTAQNTDKISKGMAEGYQAILRIMECLDKLEEKH